MRSSVDPTCPACGVPALSTTHSRRIGTLVEARRKCQQCGAKYVQVVRPAEVLNSRLLCGTTNQTTHQQTETR